MSLRNTRIADAASLAAERAAFTYHDGRDMTGFADGTANPPTRLAPHVAMAPPGSPGEGGCHVLVMRWVHDLTTSAGNNGEAHGQSH